VSPDSPDTGTPQPDENGVDPRSFDVGPTSGSAPASQPPSLDNAPLNDRQAPPAPQPTAPTPVTPVRRGGLAGIVDEFRDILSGHEQTAKVYKDEDGNQYIKHEDATGGEKWVKIIGSALRGAAAGAAVGQGPGGKARAAAAGLNAADEMEQKKQQGEKELSEQVRQENTERANAIKLKHDLAAQEFELSFAKTKATHEQIEFSQKQLDREKALGSADLGVYSSINDLPNIQKQNPTFWKDVYQNRVVAVPEIDAEGNRSGVHFFLRTPGMGSQLAPPGTKIRIYQPGEKPGDAPTFKEIEPTVPMTNDMVDAYNNAAMTKMQQWQTSQNEADLKKSEAEKNRAEASKAPSEITKNKAETSKANAEAGKAAEETAQLKTAGSAGRKTDGTWDPASLPVSVVEGNMDPSQLSKRSKSYDADLEAANQYSLERYGQPFDIAKASEDYKYANQKSTQDTLRLLHSLTGGNDNMGGTLAQLQKQFEALDNTSIPKLNEIGNWIDQNRGKPAITNFGATLLGVSDEMGKILGGGVATDSSRAEAREILDKAFSGEQGRGAIRAVRGALANRQNALTESNRYLTKQFGQMSQPPRAVVQNGRVVGYTTDGKTMTPVQGNQ